MRHLTLATAIAIAATFSLAPAKAEFGGPMKNAQGQCRKSNGESATLGFYIWEKCSDKAAATVVHHRAHHHKG